MVVGRRRRAISAIKFESDWGLDLELTFSSVRLSNHNYLVDSIPECAGRAHQICPLIHLSLGFVIASFRRHAVVFALVVVLH